MESLKIIHWNACSIVRHRAELVNYVNKRSRDERPDIICIQESYLKPNKCFKFNGYNIIRKDREHAMGGGVVILIKHDISCKSLELQTTIESLAVEVYAENGKTTIVNVYDPPDGSIHL